MFNIQCSSNSTTRTLEEDTLFFQSMETFFSICALSAHIKLSVAETQELR